MVVNRAASAAQNLKELIEFMDAPNVCTATPRQWRAQADGHRLEAVRIGRLVEDSDRAVSHVSTAAGRAAIRTYNVRRSP